MIHTQVLEALEEAKVHSSAILDIAHSVPSQHQQDEIIAIVDRARRKIETAETLVKELVHSNAVYSELNISLKYQLDSVKDRYAHDAKMFDGRTQSLMEILERQSQEVEELKRLSALQGRWKKVLLTVCKPVEFGQTMNSASNMNTTIVDDTSNLLERAGRGLGDFVNLDASFFESCSLALALLSSQCITEMLAQSIRATKHTEEEPQLLQMFQRMKRKLGKMVEGLNIYDAEIESLRRENGQLQAELSHHRERNQRLQEEQQSGSVVTVETNILMRLRKRVADLEEQLERSELQSEDYRSRASDLAKDVKRHAHAQNRISASALETSRSLATAQQESKMLREELETASSINRQWKQYFDESSFTLANKQLQPYQQVLPTSSRNSNNDNNNSDGSNVHSDSKRGIGTNAAVVVASSQGMIPRGILSSMNLCETCKWKAHHQLKLYDIQKQQEILPQLQLANNCDKRDEIQVAPMDYNNNNNNMLENSNNPAPVWYNTGTNNNGGNSGNSGNNNNNNKSNSSSNNSTGLPPPSRGASITAMQQDAALFARSKVLVRDIDQALMERPPVTPAAAYFEHSAQKERKEETFLENGEDDDDDQQEGNKEKISGTNAVLLSQILNSLTSNTMNRAVAIQKQRALASQVAQLTAEEQREEEMLDRARQNQREREHEEYWGEGPRNRIGPLMQAAVDQFALAAGVLTAGKHTGGAGGGEGHRPYHHRKMATEEEQGNNASGLSEPAADLAGTSYMSVDTDTGTGAGTFPPYSNYSFIDESTANDHHPQYNGGRTMSTVAHHSAASLMLQTTSDGTGTDINIHNSSPPVRRRPPSLAGQRQQNKSVSQQPQPHIQHSPQSSRTASPVVQLSLNDPIPMGRQTNSGQFYQFHPHPHLREHALGQKNDGKEHIPAAAAAASSSARSVRAIISPVKHNLYAVPVELTDAADDYRRSVVNNNSTAYINNTSASSSIIAASEPPTRKEDQRDNASAAAAGAYGTHSAQASSKISNHKWAEGLGLASSSSSSSPSSFPSSPSKLSQATAELILPSPVRQPQQQQHHHQLPELIEEGSVFAASQRGQQHAVKDHNPNHNPTSTTTATHSYFPLTSAPAAGIVSPFPAATSTTSAVDLDHNELNDPLHDLDLFSLSQLHLSSSFLPQQLTFLNPAAPADEAYSKGVEEGSSNTPVHRRVDRHITFAAAAIDSNSSSRGRGDDDRISDEKQQPHTGDGQKEKEKEKEKERENAIALEKKTREALAAYMRQVSESPVVATALRKQRKKQPLLHHEGNTGAMDSEEVPQHQLENNTTSTPNNSSRGRITNKLNASRTKSQSRSRSKSRDENTTYGKNSDGKGEEDSAYYSSGALNAVAAALDCARRSVSILDQSYGKQRREASLNLNSSNLSGSATGSGSGTGSGGYMKKSPLCSTAGKPSPPAASAPQSAALRTITAAISSVHLAVADMTSGGGASTSDDDSSEASSSSSSSATAPSSEDSLGATSNATQNSSQNSDLSDIRSGWAMLHSAAERQQIADSRQQITDNWINRNA